MKTFLNKFLNLKKLLKVMKNLKLVFKGVLFSLLVMFTLAACTDALVQPNDPDETNNNNGNNQTAKTGKVGFEATDGPIDDASVQGAFVTITAIKIDGETYEGFSGKQTINLLAYQNGDTKVLGLGDLEVGSYSEIALVLDYEADADGNAPGCYILTADNVKHSLAASASSTKELVLDASMTVEEDSRTDFVFDFDLRKAVTYDQSGSGEFKFVTDNELEAAIRVINKAEAGDVQGQMSNPTPLLIDQGEKVIVYAYKEGTFNASAEAQGQGASQIEFANATASTVVDANGNYQVSFLEEGDYELHFVSYEDTDNDGEFEIKGFLQLTSLTGINLNKVSVTAGAEVSLNVSITGLLPL